MALFEKNVAITPRSSASSLAPVPNVVTGTAGLDSLVRTLDGFIDREQDKLDKETVTKARLVGARAGFDPDFKPTNEQTLAGIAYDRAGSEIFINRTITATTTQINALSNTLELRSSPEQMTVELDKLKGKIAKGIPLSLLDEFQINFDVKAAEAIQGAQNKQFAERLQENTAEANKTERVLLTEATNSAEAGNVTMSLFYQGSYQNLLERSGPLSEGGSGAFTAIEIEEKLDNMKTEIVKAGIVGEFKRTPSEARPAFVAALMADNPLKELGTVEEQAVFIDEIIKTYKAQGKLEDLALGDQEDALEIARDEAAIAYQLDPENDILFEEAIVLQDDPAEVRALILFRAAAPKRSNEEIVNTLDDKANAGTLTYKDLRQPEVIEGITKEDRDKYVNKVTENTRGAEFLKSEDYKFATQLLNEDFGIGKYNILGLRDLTPAGVRMRSSLRTEMLRQGTDFNQGTQDAPPDAISIYTSLKARTDKIREKPKGFERINTKEEGLVSIPPYYLDDPERFMADDKNGSLGSRGRGLTEPEVLEYMSDLLVKKRLENKNGE